MANDEHFESISDEDLAQLLAQSEMAQAEYKPIFLEHERAYNALRSRKQRIEREIKRRDDVAHLPTKPGWYRDNSGDFWRLVGTTWTDGWGGADYPRAPYIPLTWIGNEE